MKRIAFFAQIVDFQTESTACNDTQRHYTEEPFGVDFTVLLNSRDRLFRPDCRFP